MNLANHLLFLFLMFTFPLHEENTFQIKTELVSEYYSKIKTPENNNKEIIS